MLLLVFFALLLTTVASPGIVVMSNGDTIPPKRKPSQPRNTWVDNRNTRGRLAPLVIVVILIGWLYSLAIGAIQQNWEPLTVTTPALLLVAGYSFGISITRTTDAGKEEGDFDED